MLTNQNTLGSVQKEFRAKSVLDWSVADVCDWLDSLFMPEYKVSNGADGLTVKILKAKNVSKIFGSC